MTTKIEGLSPEERKKALSKLKKAEAKAKEEASKGKKEKEKEKEKEKADPDPEGEQLAKTENPLQEASKFLDSLLRFHPMKIESHLMGCEIYSRRGALLLSFLKPTSK